jgi:hypothetical protein
MFLGCWGFPSRQIIYSRALGTVSLLHLGRLARLVQASHGPLAFLHRSRCPAFSHRLVALVVLPAPSPIQAPS